MPPAARHRLEACLRHHLGERDLTEVSAALQRGCIVHDDTAAPGVVAYRNGILFIAGREYVIADE